MANWRAAVPLSSKFRRERFAFWFLAQRRTQF
jgi:hypothetical protein